VKKLGKAVLYPHIAVMILLVPLAVGFLVSSMLLLGTKSVIACVSYALAAYTLTVWCIRIPVLIRKWSQFRNENPYMIRWRSDAHLRMNVSLLCALLPNMAYGILQVCLGMYHNTFWFASLGAYYICLAIMRLYVFRHLKKHKPGEKRRAELKKYRTCGWIFLIMNLTLSAIVIFMLYFNRTFQHHMITAIAMAAYTFFAFSAVIVSIIKNRKHSSPVYSAVVCIRLAAACVSMLTLTATLLTTFDEGKMSVLGQKVMLGCVGIAVSAAVVTMAVIMIVQGTKQLKLEVEHEQS